MYSYGPIWYNDNGGLTCNMSFENHLYVPLHYLIIRRFICEFVTISNCQRICHTLVLYDTITYVLFYITYLYVCS